MNLAKRIEEQLLAAGFQRSVLLITEGPARKGLAERVRRAKALAADLFLSIHHDSVPDRFLEKWEVEGEERSFSDRFSGHSIFISQDSSDYAGSLLFARLLGGQLQERGLKYTPHYTDPIMGNRKRRLVDAHAGVYRYDQLIVLRTTGMPAVLLEAGSIINREEELRMGSAEHQALTSAAVADAVTAFCKTHRPRAPANVASQAGKVSRQTTAPTGVTPVQQSGSAEPSSLTNRFAGIGAMTRPGQCPFWVISGHGGSIRRCPVYPRKQTFGRRLVQVGFIRNLMSSRPSVPNPKFALLCSRPLRTSGSKGHSIMIELLVSL